MQHGSANINSRTIWRENMLGYLSANSFLKAWLEENCELRGTDNVQGQISELILTPNGGYCVYYSSNLYRSARSFEY